MSAKLFVFYFLFMFFAIGIFSFENRRPRDPRLEIKREIKKEEAATPKKTPRRYFRYSNLC